MITADARPASANSFDPHAIGRLAQSTARGPLLAVPDSRRRISTPLAPTACRSGCRAFSQWAPGAYWQSPHTRASRSSASPRGQPQRPPVSAKIADRGAAIDAAQHVIYTNSKDSNSYPSDTQKTTLSLGNQRSE
jgi:hypothetical protein